MCVLDQPVYIVNNHTGGNKGDYLTCFSNGDLRFKAQQEKTGAWWYIELARCDADYLYVRLSLENRMYLVSDGDLKCKIDYLRDSPAFEFVMYQAPNDPNSFYF